MSKVKVLIIEDNETDQRMLAKVLSKADYDLTFSPSKRDAMNLLVDGNYDFVITDLQLKNGFGFEILESIVKITQPFGIPLGVITGLYDAESAIRAVRELGIAFYLDKNVMLAQKYTGLHPLLRIIAESIARASYIASERAIAAETITRLTAENERTQALLAATIAESGKRQEILATANNAQAIELAEWRKVSQPKTWLTKNRMTLITSTITAVVAVVVAMMAKC